DRPQLFPRGGRRRPDLALLPAPRADVLIGRPRLSNPKGGLVPLIDLPVPARCPTIPGDVRAFLREARKRSSRLQRRGRHPAFVPSDYAGAYSVLAGLAAAGLAPGNLLCEWGCGLGAIACLAALLDYDACGLEVEADLVGAARRLAADFELP